MPNRHSALTRIHTMVDTDHIYANAAARTGDTYATEDVGKLLWQQDDDSFYILLTTAPTFSTLGAAGLQGDTGDQGDTGVSGGAGAQGDTGDDGDTGVAGAQGGTGADGDTGADSTVQGDTGADGDTGLGEFGGDSQSYNFSTTITDADPGSGNFRYNNATPASVTQLYIDDENSDAVDIVAWLQTIDDSTNAPPARLRIFEEANSANFAVFDVTSITDLAGYFRFVVVHVDGNGTFADTTPIVMTLAIIGDQGDQGDTGADSTVQGDTGADGDTGVAGSGGFEFKYLFSANIVAPPDAAGDIEFNNATLASVTEVYVHDTDDDANDLDLNLDEIGVGDQLMIRSQSDADFVVYWVDSNTDSGTYHTFVVRYINNSGGFADNEAISLTPSGRKGIFGGDSQPYVYSTITTDATPGDTFMRFNNTDLVLVTEMYADFQNLYGVSVNDWHEANIEGTNIPLGRMRIFATRDPERYAIYDVTAAVQVASAYWRYTLVFVQRNPSLVDLDEVVMTFSQAGDQGKPGGYTFDYLFSTNTVAPPDAAGDIEFNNATPASVTSIFVHDTDSNGADLDLVLDDIAVSDKLRIFSSLAQNNDFVAFSVDSNTDSGAYHTLGVTYLAGSGTFADAEPIHLGIS